MPFVQLQRYLDWLHCTKLILIIVINCYLPVDHHYQTVVLKHMIREAIIREKKDFL